MMTCKPDFRLITRLLIKLDADFFSYSKAEQDRKRQHFLNTDYDRIYHFLYPALFNIQYDPKSDENEDMLNHEQLNRLNAHITALCGIGENSFKFNQPQGSEFDLNAFNTLHAYDLDQFNYQQAANQRDFPKSYQEKPYRLYLHHHWVRLLDSEQNFYYSTLSSLSHYVCDGLEEIRRDLIDELIPHEFVEGPDHGDNVEGGMLWDLKIDANGREAELDELKSRSWAYHAEVYERLNEEFHHSTAREVYFRKHGDDVSGHHWDVIVRNAETAKQISFTSFLSDCQKYLQPIENLDALIERKKEKLRRFLQEAYDDIVENFDPKIVKFKKKRKIVMSSGALEDLSRLTEEDE